MAVMAHQIRSFLNRFARIVPICLLARNRCALCSNRFRKCWSPTRFLYGAPQRTEKALFPCVPSRDYRQTADRCAIYMTRSIDRQSPADWVLYKRFPVHYNDSFDWTTKWVCEMKRGEDDEKQRTLLANFTDELYRRTSSTNFEIELCSS